MAEDSGGCRKSWGGSEIIRFLFLLCLRTTAYMHSTSPYHPHGASIFPIHQTSNRTCKKKSKQNEQVVCNKGQGERGGASGKYQPLPPIHPIILFAIFHFMVRRRRSLARANLSPRLHLPPRV